MHYAALILLRSNEEYEGNPNVDYGPKKPIFTLTTQKLLYTLTEIFSKSIDPPTDGGK